MGAASEILALQDLFVSLCDGEWEHGQGITIENLDNPGWTIRICISGTKFENIDVTSTMTNRSDDDWIHVATTRNGHDKFLQLACGPRNLAEALRLALSHLK